MEENYKMGVFNKVEGVVMGVVTVALVLAAGYLALDKFQATLTVNGAAYNAIDTLIGANGLGNVDTFLPAIIVIALVVLLIIMVRKVSSKK